MLVPLFLALAAPAQPPAASPPPPLATASGLRFQILTPGSGRRPTVEDAVLIAYEGRLADGTVFDRSEQPVGMLVTGVIPGFAEALQMMHQGGTYRFWIPAHLAYGAEGGGPIPPNAELDFTVTLVDIGRPAPPAPAEPGPAD